MIEKKEIDKDSIFYATDETKKELKLENKQCMEDNIKSIFVLARMEKSSKTELTLEEITIAYYNLITKPEKEANPGKKIPVKTKKDIAQKLFMMRQDKKNVKATIELVPGVRGTYRLKSA